MVTTPLLLDIDSVRSRWPWLLGLGAVMVALGIIALLEVPIATLAAVLVLGWLMIVSGVVEAIHAFGVKGWGGVFLHVVAGILGVVVGLMILTHPLAGALVWTVLFAALFIVLGAFRAIAAVRL